MEERVALLETNFHAMTEDVAGMLERIQNNSTNVEFQMKHLLTLNAKQQEQWFDFRQKFEEYQQAMIAEVKPPKKTATKTMPQSTQVMMRDGVPLDVYQQIAARAAQKWPNDYDMQVYEIKEQTSAYQKLRGYQ
jgi:hypothetical protein